MIKKSATLIATLALALGGGLFFPSTGQAAATMVLSTRPLPPKKMMVLWTPYSGSFTVDHYDITLNPGSRVSTSKDTKTTFSDLTWGVSYTARVVAVGASNEMSPAATITVPAGRLTALIRPSWVRRGTSVPLVGELMSSEGGPIAGRDVFVQVDRAPFDGVYQTVRRLKTRSDGTFATRVRPIRSTTYRLLYRQRNTAGGFAYEQLRVRRPR